MYLQFFGIILSTHTINLQILFVDISLCLSFCLSVGDTFLRLIESTRERDVKDRYQTEKYIIYIIHILYREKEKVRDKERQSDRETEWYRDRVIERQSDRETEWKRDRVIERKEEKNALKLIFLYGCFLMDSSLKI